MAQKLNNISNSKPINKLKETGEIVEKKIGSMKKEFKTRVEKESEGLISSKNLY